jgi:hypothetical protein
LLDSLALRAVEGIYACSKEISRGFASIAARKLIHVLIFAAGRGANSLNMGTIKGKIERLISNRVVQCSETAKAKIDCWKKSEKHVKIY